MKLKDKNIIIKVSILIIFILILILELRSINCDKTFHLDRLEQLANEIKSNRSFELPLLHKL